MTFKFAGEWVLRAVADGNGVGDVFYGPGTVEPTTPLLTILNGGTVVDELTFQDIFGEAGLNITVPGVAEIAIGEDPRAIGGATDSKPIETTTYAAGAVDVVRVTLLNGTLAPMSASATWRRRWPSPTAGSSAASGCRRRPTPRRSRPGTPSTGPITVSNPNDCILTALKVVDTISADTGIKWSVVGTNPKANTQTNTSVIWNDVGPLNPGASKDLVITVTVDKASGGGKFLDEAVATGVCGPAAGAAAAEAGVGVPLEARVSLNLPEVTAILAEAPLRGELPRTGGLLAMLPALALLGTGLVLRRLKARRG